MDHRTGIPLFVYFVVVQYNGKKLTTIFFVSNLLCSLKCQQIFVLEESFMDGKVKNVYKAVKTAVFCIKHISVLLLL